VNNLPTAQSCYSVADWPGVELVTFRSRANALPTEPPAVLCRVVFKTLAIVYKLNLFFSHLLKLILKPVSRQAYLQ